LLRLQIEQNDYSDETVYRTLPPESQVKDQHDAQFDAYKMFSWDKTKPQIYTTDALSSDYFAINSQPDIAETKIIPVGLYIGAAGEYQINMTENHFYGTHIWLEDKYLNKNLNLLKNSIYTFDQSAQTANDRFYLHFEINNAPTVVGTVPNQTLYVNDSLSLILPEPVFSDVDFEDTLTLSAALSDGSLLPAWLNFNASVGGFYGLPDSAQILTVRITAADMFGEIAQTDFKITVLEKPELIGNPDRISINIYPNPNSGHFNIKTNGLTHSEMRVSDISGKIIYETQINFENTLVDLSRLTKGIYFIEIRNEKGTFRKKMEIR
jgi:hypothetical protein